VIWKPQAQPTTQPIDKKGKGKATNEISSPSDTRSVWVRFHPSVFMEVFEILKEAASRTLQNYKEQNGDMPEAVLELINMQGLLNVFEIMGPKASQVIKGVLTPVNTGKRPTFAEVCFIHEALYLVCTWK
jgi:ribonuclease P/MRP protein subunit POP1